MGSRMKEEERIERMLRALLKLPENKRCINCNSLGPQYVCTTFLTFVCTNCSGVHREFTHRVKSVSMAKFSVKEVNSLQAGGNEPARQTYFKEFDPQYHTFPDGSNIARLREFIKNVYVDRKYSGEKKLQKLQSSDEPDEGRVSAFHGGSRSFRDDNRKVVAPYGVSRSFRDEERKVAVPYGGSRSLRDEDWKVTVPSTKSRSFRDQDWKVAGPYVGSKSFHDSEDRYGRHYALGSSPSARGAEQNVVKYYYDEQKSPRYCEENSRTGGFRRNPVRFEVVDNRIRDDRKVHGGITTPRSENRLPEKMLPPIFRENTVIHDPKHADDSPHNQKMKDGKAMDYRREKLESLNDFNTDPEPSDDAVKSQQPQTPPPDNDNTWASFDSSPKDNAPQVPKPETWEASPPVPRPDSLEALLLELSPPISVPATTSENPRKDDAPSTTCTNNTPAGGAPPGAPLEQVLTLFDTAKACTSAPTSTSVPVQPSNKPPWQAVSTSGGETSVAVTEAEQLPSTQLDQSSISFAADRGFPAQRAVTPVGASDNSSSSFTTDTQQSLSVSTGGPSQSMLRNQSLPVETKFGNREELPVDLFAGHYTSIPSQASVWLPAPAHGMGFNMQYYPNIAHAPAFRSPRKKVNPFDINDDKPLGRSTHFPSMSSVEEALHNASVPPSLTHSSSLGSFPSDLLLQPPKQGSLMPSHSLPSFAAFSHDPYMGEQLQNNPQVLRPQEFSSDAAAAFDSLGSSQQPFQHVGMTYPAPSNSETYSSTGGNPFG